MTQLDTENPVLAPIRRWVLYSRTRLVGTVAGVIALMVVIGTITSKPAPPGVHEASAAGASPSATGSAVAVSYDLVEVSESMIAGKSQTWLTASAPATAMAYLHTFVDRQLSDMQWTSKIGMFTADRPGESFAAVRPARLVAITGPTRSELVTGAGGSRMAQVSIPTDAGPMSLTLKVVDGKRWAVDAPLPTLELSEVGQPPTSSRTPPVTPTVRPPATTAAPSGSPSTAQPSTSSTSSKPPSTPNPPPTGEIPLPELDTPLPGAL